MCSPLADLCDGNDGFSVGVPKKIGLAFLWRREAVSSFGFVFGSTSAVVGHCVVDRKNQGGDKSREWSSVSMAAGGGAPLLPFLLSREREKRRCRGKMVEWRLCFFLLSFSLFSKENEVDRAKCPCLYVYLQERDKEGWV